MSQQKITLQQIFNLAWEHFIIRQEEPGVEGEICMYLTSDGRKCAIGLALPDGHDATKSRMTFPGLVRTWPELFDVPNHDHLLWRFQMLLHDALVVNGKWNLSLDERASRYREVAKEYGLTVPDTERTYEQEDNTPEDL